jgi:hypothetical protein
MISLSLRAAAGEGLLSNKLTFISKPLIKDSDWFLSKASCSNL